jgi:hypothetical protein
VSPRVAPRGAENDTSSPGASESPDPSEPNPTPPIDLNALRPQLQELQKLVEQMEAQRQDPAQSEGQDYDADRFNNMPLQDPRSPNGAQDSARGEDQNEPERPSASRTGRDSSRLSNTPGDAKSSDRSSSNSSNSMPEIPEFLKQELRKLKLLPDSRPGNRSSDSNSDVADNSSPGNQPSGTQSGKPDRSPPSDPSSRSSKAADSSLAENRAAKQPAIDIEKELQQKGFAKTLEKIFQRAKEESLKPKPPAEKAIADAEKSPGTGSGTGGASDNRPGGNTPQSSPELSESMINVLDGLKDDLVEIARDAKFNDPPERSDRFRPGRRESAGSESSTLNELRKKAADFLAGPNESPLNSPPAARSTGSGTTSAANALDAASQFDLMPLLILVTVLAAAAIGLYGARHLRMRSANALALQMAGPPIQPAEIQTRADVIRAFHDLALRSTRSVQTWWTHRAVQRVIATAAPEKQAAVETLANAYEEARYLPQEVELSSEQIQSARNALQQCRTGGKV